MLSRVRLRNFKRFRDSNIPVGDLTILMGTNGAGKSTFIQSLLVARQSHQSRALSDGFLALSGNLTRIGTGKDVLFEGAGTDEPVEIEFECEAGSRKISAKYEAQSDRLPLQAAVSLDGYGGLGADRFTYLSAERLGPRLSTPLTEADAASSNMGVQGEGALAVLEYQRSHLLHSDDPRLLVGAARSVEDQTQGYLSEISPGARLTLTRHSSLDSVSAAFNFVGEGGVRTAQFRPTNVGFGISYSLPIIVACLTAQPGSVLIVENPEAHLHTVGQRRMTDLLVNTAAAGIQVIIETHSREVFYRARSVVSNEGKLGDRSLLHYFSVDGTGDISKLGIHTLRPISASLQDWPQDFFDAFGSPGDLIKPVG